MLQHTPLHGIDLTVSRLALGRAKFGLSRSDAQVYALLDACVEGGGTLIDTL